MLINWQEHIAKIYDLVISDFFKYIDNPTIVIGGAGTGISTGVFLYTWERPCCLHLIDPSKEHINILTKRFRNDTPYSGIKINIYHGALAAKNQKRIVHITNNYYGSSLYGSTEIHKKVQGAAVNIKHSTEIDCFRLDSILKHIDFLELQINGAELAALEGCGKLIKDIKVILTQAMFSELYNRQSFFSDVDQFLRANNFELFNLYNIWGKPPKQKLFRALALYINTRFYKRF